MDQMHLDKSNNGNDILYELIQKTQREREIEKLLIFQMWIFLTREKVEPDDFMDLKSHKSRIRDRSRQVRIQSLHSKMSYFFRKIINTK